jgi:superfamily II DNA or RNA helicase
MKIRPRDYQHDDIDKLRACYRNGDRAVVYQLPTGGGKTIVSSFIVHSTSTRKIITWFLVHRQELVRQSIRTFNELGIPHGVIATGFTPDPFADVQIGMVQTVANRLGKLRAPGFIVQDEAHHLRAKTFSSIVDYYPEAKILGLTATPCRLDGQGLGIQCGGHFDSMVNGPTLSALIDQGYLCRPKIFTPSLGDLSGLHKRYGEFIQKETLAVLDKPKITGCAVEHYQKICHNVPAIVFCASVGHAENVAAQFHPAGYRAASIDGAMHDNDRKGRLTSLGNGGLHLLTSCDLISEGFDLPVVGAAILLRPTASLSMLLQQIGRALRPIYAHGYDLRTPAGRLAAIAASVKPHAYIIDHVGNINRHQLHGLGRPEWDIEWTLDGEVKRKKGASDSGPPFKQCPQCYGVSAPSPSCPMCGFIYEVQARELEQVDGDLQEIDEMTLQRLKKIEDDRAKYARMREVSQLKTLEDFQKYGQDKGYKPNWAYINYNIRAKRRGSPAPTLPGV